MALSTKNIPVASVSKTFKPGNIYARLSGITHERDNYIIGGLIVKLYLEGPDLGDGFEGFYIDPNNHTKGRYKGQIGTVAASQYSFKDAMVNGRKIERDVEILRFISELSKAMGKEDTINSLEAETIEEYIELTNAILTTEDAWLYWTLGGKEYEKGGYTNYGLFLVKSDHKIDKFSFGPSKEDVIKFNPETHIVKKKKKEVETISEFNTNSNAEFDIPGSVSDDLPF
jgi:hypothetical protein